MLKEEDDAAYAFIGSMFIGTFVGLFCAGITMLIVPFFLGIFQSILVVLGVFTSSSVGITFLIFTFTDSQKSKKTKEDV